MPRDWESSFSSWAKPPSQTEQDRCSNAESAVKKAIAGSDQLREKDIKVFAQGSYRNNTNVRQDSDVDIAIVCCNPFFPEYPEGTNAETFGNSNSNYSYQTYKNEVEQALVEYFGRRSVIRGRKSFDIKENSYRVEADATPFFEHRDYYLTGEYRSGVELRPDNEDYTRVINWPDQHYENGVKKNNDTGRGFKSIVRILKYLCNEMAEARIAQAKDMPSYLIESMVWNIPNDHFGKTTWYDEVGACLAFLFNNTRLNNDCPDTDCKDWAEVNDIKYLFHSSQKWTRQQAFNFIDAAWNYIGLE